MPSFYAKSDPQPRRIIFVLFDRTKLIDVTGPVQVFNDARLPSGAPAYAISLVSESGGAVMTDAGIALTTLPFDSVIAAPVDTVIVSGGDSALQAARSPAMLAFIAAISGRCRRLCSVCLGAFILAAGGHLDTRRATTHWEGTARLQQEYPAITVEQDAIFVEDRAVWTSAGVTAGIDMALAMVEQDLGRKAALWLAQSLVLYIRRMGGQSQFSAALRRQVSGGNGSFDALLAHMTAMPGADLSVPKLAAMAHMSPRNFSRLFTAQIGVSPGRFVEELRVHLACERLQNGEADLPKLAHSLGFGSAERMRRAFHRIKCVAPSEYRARFGGR